MDDVWKTFDLKFGLFFMAFKYFFGEELMDILLRNGGGFL